MGRVGSSLLATVLACVVGTIAFVGCSADGSGGDGEFTAQVPTDPSVGLQPGTSSGGEQPVVDSGTKKDAGNKDAQADAGPPPPNAGDPCTKIDAIVEKQCGACGKQSTVCLADDGGASGGHWSVYSDCAGELAGGCVPGETGSVACGNCGTLTRTCTKYCSWTNTACTGQPVDSCPPGTFDLTTAGCSDANTYRQRSCKNDCSYNPFGGACAAPPTVVNVPPTVGSVSSTIAVLASTKTMAKLTGTCPNAAISTTLTTPYVYIQVQNTLATPATVSIYNSIAPLGVVFDTTLAAYAGAVSPTADAARKTCEKGVATYGTTALTGDFKFASLDGTRKVTIPAGGTVSVYVAAEKAYDATKPTESTGPVKLSVKTEALE
jgi:hypothetical protein